MTNDITNEQAIRLLITKRAQPSTDYQMAKVYGKSIKALEQESSRDIEEIAEIMRCDADAETKCKMISNILTAKPHYFESREGYGYWRAVYQGDEIINYRCTKCEFGNTFGKSTHNMNFCPFCGVKIIGIITDKI